MKKRNLIILIVVALLFALAMPLSANDSYSVLTYNMAVPFGDLKDATSDFSWRGWGFSYRNFIRDHLSLGFSFAWQGFSEKYSGTYESGPISATGTFVLYANYVPLMATGHFYTGEMGGMRLYGGLGIGAFRIQDRYDFGLYSFYEDHWHFGLVPEAGVVIPVGGSFWNLMGSVTYNYAFKTNDYEASSYMGIQVGFAIGN
jgi:hypothetical protein